MMNVEQYIAARDGQGLTIRGMSDATGKSISTCRGILERMVANGEASYGPLLSGSPGRPAKTYDLGWRPEEVLPL